MPANPKVTILLADEDALRRDGLAAVLAGTEQFEVVGGVSDGESALNEIRDLRPDVAVVDLNLPKLHGIELVRRIRSEALGTKVVILAGTSDEEIVREVVRAGGDGYLLKNGPARHLVDAISYVRDGGQYFSPQLGRDGRDRNLLQEPRRTPAEDPEEYEDEVHDEGEDRPAVRRSRPAPSRPIRRAPQPANLRDRIREEAAPGLADRDYEIMSMMADGIRPILDRLDEIDNRVAQMEVGDAPVPVDPRGWLSNQLADTLRDSRGADLAVLGRNVQDIETRLPELIEEAVTKRFQQMAGKLQEEIEETHVRTLETFVKNIQVKLVQRVSALEQDMSKQASAMNDLREYSMRTEDNLSRLISGVDKLAQELPKRLAQRPEPVTASPSPPPAAAPAANRVKVRKRRSPVNGKAMKFMRLGIAAAIVLGLLFWGASRLMKRETAVAAPADASAAAPPPGSEAPKSNVPMAAGGDTKTKMQAAQEYVDRKDYATAESIYKQVVQAEPNNVDALKALASVLYREDKIDESATVLDKIPKN